MFFAIGLGNPGDAYVHTRHNVGRFLLEHLAAGAAGVTWKYDKHARAQVASYPLASAAVTFLLPETYMDQSGETAAYVVRTHGVPTRSIIVVHDEVDLPFGTVRISVGRGGGGHNGVKSIIAALGGTDFIRIRIGIARTSFWTGAVKRPTGGEALAEYVLAPFSARERAQVALLAPVVGRVLEVIVRDGVERAMNEFNTAGEKGKG